MGNLLYALIGILVGALVNILADDLPKRQQPGRPHCPHCDAHHPPIYWLAITRWLIKRGRCPACGRQENRRPLLIELATALLFGLLWQAYDGLTSALLINSVYFSVFMLILVTDLEHRLILHVVTLPSILFALLVSALTISPKSALLGAAVGFIFFYLFFLVGNLTFGAGAMGFGDVTLSTLIGAAVGFPMVIVALLSGILSGGIITTGLLLTRQRRLHSKVPYGPFLLIGATVTLLWGKEIVLWYLR